MTATTKANTNYRPSLNKMDILANLPPKQFTKTAYNVDVNMTESKIFQAKKGLELLKKKMVRNGKSREKSRS